MSTAQQPEYVTPEQYLAFEATSAVRHEYIDGQLYAMSGTTDNHNQIAGSLYARLKSHLRGGPCRVYIGDLKVRLESLNCFYYPDLLITCSDADHAAALVKRYPAVLVEVLSDSTEAFDRGRKFSHYRTLDSLQEYVLIAQDEMRVDHYRRGRDGEWVLTAWDSGDQFRLPTLNFICDVAALYEDVEGLTRAELAAT